MIKIKQLGSDEVRLTFSLPVEAHPGPVSVVGDFNEWDPYAHPLVKRSNGTRSASVSISLPHNGRVCFRYLDSSGHWFGDPDSDAYEANDHGGTNEVVDVFTRLRLNGGEPPTEPGSWGDPNL